MPTDTLTVRVTWSNGSFDDYDGCIDVVRDQHTTTLALAPGQGCVIISHYNIRSIDTRPDTEA